jgi:hypothetical protein
LVFSLLGGACAAGYLYQRLTNPAAVRRQVVAKLRDMLPGAEVTLDSARLRLLGGIALNELRLKRRDDPERTDFAYFPSAILYHDKEQILNGKLIIRKVELNRPRLRLIRDRKGHLNILGLTRAPSGDEPQPTVIIHHGTIILEDRLASVGKRPVEISDVNLTIQSGPYETISFEGDGTSTLTGPIQIKGAWWRQTKALTLTFHASEVAIGPPLLKRLAGYRPEFRPHIQALKATADLRAELKYSPGIKHPWHHDVHLKIAGGELRHPLLPLAFDHLEASLHCLDGHVTVEKLSARGGPATVTIHEAWARASGTGADFCCKGRVEHLPVTAGLVERLPEKVRMLHDLYTPKGVLSMDFDLRRCKDRWERLQCVLHAEKMSASFIRFDYPLDQITGTVDADIKNQLYKVNLTGYTGPRPVTVRGQCRGEGPNAAIDVDIKGTDIPLDEKLLKALQPATREVARSFHLTGLGDITAKIHHGPGSSTFDNQFLVQLHHAALKWEPFPYPLNKASAILEIKPKYWVLREFHGMNGKAEFQARGRSYPPLPGHTPADAQTAIEITGRNVPMDNDFKEATRPYPGLTRAWETFDPSGTMNFTARIDRLPKQAQDLDVTVDVHDSSVVPKFFPLLLHDLSGRLRYRRDLVQVFDLKARHGQSNVKLPLCEVKLYPGGGYYATLTNLEANPLVPDEGFVKALPPPLRKSWLGLHFNGPLALKTGMIISQAPEPGVKPVIYWDGAFWMREAAFQVGLPIQKATGCVACVGRHDGLHFQGVNCNVELNKAILYNQPFHDIHTRLDIYKDTPDVVIMGIKAPLFGGQISGPGRIELNSTLRYEVDLTASEINLAKFGRHNLGPGAQLSGIIGGRLHIKGKGGSISCLEGRGSVDMPKGQLYNLPPLVDLLKFLGLRWPDRTLFDQAHAAFTIHGEQLHFNELELFGNAISLHGEGDMNLDGRNVRLDFIPVWGRIEQVLPPVWQPLPSTIGKNLLMIEVRGEVGKDKGLHFNKKPVPGLVKPLLEMRNRFLKLTGKQVPGGGDATR